MCEHLGIFYVQMGSKYFLLHQTRFETPEMVLLGEWRLVLGGRGQTLMGRLGAYICCGNTQYDGTELHTKFGTNLNSIKGDIARCHNSNVRKDKQLYKYR